MESLGPGHFIFYVKLLGGLSLFFYGFRTLSESLQNAASDVIRTTINGLTNNRAVAVLVGMAVTTIVQSSQATTVMVVGLVNAGLMQLTQAIAVIFGSNIGTTITGWIISLESGQFGLLFVSLGVLPLLFSNRMKTISAGRVLFSIGLIFLGLETMREALAPLKNEPGFINAVSYFKEPKFASYLATTFIGCFFTIILQSSTVMFGVTVALASTGVIPFDTAVALIFGENLGTTVATQLASIGANVSAKRAARAHLIFNLLGVGLILPIMPFYVEFIDWIIPYPANLMNSTGDHIYIGTHIAAAHTLFNLCMTLLLVPFISQIESIVCRMVPDTVEGKEEKHLIHLGHVNDMVPATAIISVHEALKKNKEILNRMFDMTVSYLLMPKADARVLARIKKYEEITDNIQREITLFVCRVMERELSPQQSGQTQAFLRIADEYESIADYLETLATYRTKLDSTLRIEGELKDELEQFALKVREFFNLASSGLDSVYKHDSKLNEAKAEDIRLLANEIREKHVKRVAKGEYGALSSLTYSDMIVALRKVRSHSLNVSQALDHYYV